MKAYRFIKEDTMLDIICEGAEEVSLILDRAPFPGSDKLILTERCDPYIGGGLPDEIFIKRTQVSHK
jgi:hypothetical protein